MVFCNKVFILEDADGSRNFLDDRKDVRREEHGGILFSYSNR